MALSEISAICNKCGTQFNALPTRSFLGFQKLVCPTCKEKLTYPLTSGYRATYQVLFALMVLSIIGQFSQGQVGFPGGLGIAIIFALFRDRSISKEVSKLMPTK